MYRQSPGLRAGDSIRGCELDDRLSRGNLNTGRSGNGRSDQPPYDFARTCAGAHLGTEGFPDPLQPSMAERAETDTIQGSSPVEKIDQDIHTRIGLRVNVEHRLWKGLEKIGKKGNRLAIVDESPGHLLSRHVGDVSIDTARAQQIRIVKCDEMPVIRDLDIRLEIPEADAGSGIERGK